MAYTSLFKQDDVRVTQVYKGTTHKGIDLSRGVVRQPIYLPNRAVEGVVWKILVGYTNSGVYYKDAPIVYVKHKDGSGSRYIHSALTDVKVVVGQSVKAGDRICSTGVSGKATGDHLHFEWLKKWDDISSHIDPQPIVMNDMSALSIGDNVVINAETRVRTSPNTTSSSVTAMASAGSVGNIRDGARFSDGYEWWDVYFNDHNGWMANVNGDRLTKTTDTITSVNPSEPTPEPTPPVEPPEPPQQTECQKLVERLEEELRGVSQQCHALKTTNEELVSALKVGKDRLSKIEQDLEISNSEHAKLFDEYEVLLKEKNRFENQYMEAVKELGELKQPHWTEKLRDRLFELWDEYKEAITNFFKRE